MNFSVFIKDRVLPSHYLLVNHSRALRVTWFTFCHPTQTREANLTRMTGGSNAWMFSQNHWPQFIEAFHHTINDQPEKRKHFPKGSDQPWQKPCASCSKSRGPSPRQWWMCDQSLDSVTPKGSDRSPVHNTPGVSCRTWVSSTLAAAVASILQLLCSHMPGVVGAMPDLFVLLNGAFLKWVPRYPLNHPS